MTRDRFEAILANLSFMKVGDSRFDGDKLAKLREIDQMLLKRCQQAWDIEQHFTIDESRIKIGSKFCSFVWLMCAACPPLLSFPWPSHPGSTQFRSRGSAVWP